MIELNWVGMHIAAEKTLAHRSFHVRDQFRRLHFLRWSPNQTLRYCSLYAIWIPWVEVCRRLKKASWLQHTNPMAWRVEDR